MKTQVKNLLVTLDKNELVELTKEGKETVATDIKASKAKTVFTAADLWNIHRMRKVRTGRRMFI